MISVRFTGTWVPENIGWLSFGGDVRVHPYLGLVDIVGTNWGRQLNGYDFMDIRDRWKPEYGPMPIFRHGSMDGWVTELINGYRRMQT